MARHMAASSSRIRFASSSRRCFNAAASSDEFSSATRTIRSSAQLRLTAVGRAEASRAATRFSSATISCEFARARFRIPSTAPIAPAMPIAGAPRTCRRRIASKTCSGVRQSIIRTSPGSVVWSMIRRQPSSPPTHSTARSFVRKAVPPHRETCAIKSPGRPPGQLAAVERRAAGSYNAGAIARDAE